VSAVDCALVGDGDASRVNTELQHHVGTVNVDMADLLARDADIVEALARHLTHPTTCGTGQT
jgi:hypothetical protein